MSDREFGTVKWFEDSKGYGFIRRDGGGDIFVHFTAIEMDGHRRLERGQRVSFTIIQEKGPQGLSRNTFVYSRGSTLGKAVQIGSAEHNWTGEQLFEKGRYVDRSVQWLPAR